MLVTLVSVTADDLEALEHVRVLFEQYRSVLLAEGCDISAFRVSTPLKVSPGPKTH